MKTKPIRNVGVGDEKQMSGHIVRAHEFIRNTKLGLNKLELIEGMHEIKS